MLAMKEDTGSHTAGQQLYTPAEAVVYLREQRGLIFTVGGLRNRRKRGKAQTSRVLDRISLWTQKELDAIEPSRRTQRVEPRIQKADENSVHDDTSNS